MTNIMHFINLLILFCLIGRACSGTAEQWKSRTIYQVLTDRFARNDGSSNPCSDLGWYCGGGYIGLKNQLDYIQGMGFDAIWISPIIDNRDGGYHGYWGRNIYELNQNFGSEKEFVDFIDECHRRGIWVMLDVVANHMGNLNQVYTQNVPFNSSEHYHTFCIIQQHDFETHNQDRIENCRLASLSDLKQENDFVRTSLLSWISGIVRKYKIDGLRIDTVPEVPKWFWSQFRQAAGVYTVGEVFDYDMGYLAGYLGSMDAVLNYPFFRRIRDTIFNVQDMYSLRGYYYEWAQHIDPNKLNYFCNFVDNHDNERVLSWPGNWLDKIKHYKVINAMTLTSMGIPIIYYGTEQYYSGGNDPQNRQVLWNHMDKNSQMYKFITLINSIRKRYQIWNEVQVERYVDTQIFAYSRGKVLVLLTNKVSGTVTKYISYHPYAYGQVICNVFYPTTDCITVYQGFNIYLLNGEVKIYVPQ